MTKGGKRAGGLKAAGVDADFNRTLSDWATTFAKYPITVKHELDETKIVPLVGELHDIHDVVVIDTAGAASQATIFAIGCADLVLVPVAPSSADVVEAIKTVNLIRSASQMIRREIRAASSSWPRSRGPRLPSTSRRRSPRPVCRSLRPASIGSSRFRK